MISLKSLKVLRPFDPCSVLEKLLISLSSYRLKPIPSGVWMLYKHDKFKLQIELNFFDAASSSTASLVACSEPTCSNMVQTSAATKCFTQDNQCGYSLQYADGSGTSGYYVTDLMLFYFDMIYGASLIANYSAPVVFGCSTYQSGGLTKTDRAFDGILGFGQQEVSVISQLSLRRITPKVFPHCLKGDCNGGATLVVGEILEPSIVYSPLVPSQ